jgi:membrane protease YdiL (CAAX protease family)
LATDTALQAPRHERGALAPLAHTAALVGLIVAVAVTGILLRYFAAAGGVSGVSAASASSRIVSQYLPLLLVNAGLTVYCCRVFRGRNALPELLGERWLSPGRTPADLLLGLLGLVLVLSIEGLSARWFGVSRHGASASLLPTTEAERVCWALVAVSVGFCEEVIYRGYLQTQLAAFSGRVGAGIILQAVLFGLAHADQGAFAALRIATYGLLLGALAHFRQSLLPCIACHVGIDLMSAFV